MKRYLLSLALFATPAFAQDAAPVCPGANADTAKALIAAGADVKAADKVSIRPALPPRPRRRLGVGRSVRARLGHGPKLERPPSRPALDHGPEHARPPRQASAGWRVAG